MDHRVFDKLAKTLADAAPRREAIRAFAAVGLGAMAGRLGGNIVEAKKKRKRKKKKKTATTPLTPLLAPALPPVELTCLKSGLTCGPALLPCCNASGLMKCAEIGSSDCPVTGLHCCGVEGERCDPAFGAPAAPDADPDTFGNCSCCAGLFCAQQLPGQFFCTDEDT